MRIDNESSLYYRYLYTKRQLRKHLAPDGVHVPCKKEATMLRKIKKESGLSEEEIREIPKYRQMLSEASQRVIDRKNNERFTR